MSTSYPLRQLLVVCAALAALTACGGGSAGSSGGTDRAAQPNASASDSPRRSSVEAAPADLANFACSRKRSGRWAARGVITNSGRKPMVYTVTVVTVDSGDEVLGERIKSFRLTPDEAHQFTWRRFYAGDADACMPHVERRPA